MSINISQTKLILLTNYYTYQSYCNNKIYLLNPKQETQMKQNLVDLPQIYQAMNQIRQKPLQRNRNCKSKNKKVQYFWNLSLDNKTRKNQLCGKQNLFLWQLRTVERSYGWDPFKYDGWLYLWQFRTWVHGDTVRPVQTARNSKILYYGDYFYES